MARAISEADAARYLGLSKKVLATLRKDGMGPPVIKIETGGIPAHVYLIEDLDDFLLSRRIEVPPIIGSKKRHIDPNRRLR